MPRFLSFLRCGAPLDGARLSRGFVIHSWGKTFVLTSGMAWSFGFTNAGPWHLNILSVCSPAMLNWHWHRTIRRSISCGYSPISGGRGLAPRPRFIEKKPGGGAYGARNSDGGHLVIRWRFCAVLTRLCRRRPSGVHRRGRGFLICTVGGLRRDAAVLVVADRNFAQVPHGSPSPSSRWLAVLTSNRSRGRSDDVLSTTP